MVTTVQLQGSTKRELEHLKESPRQTYEEVIERLIELAKEETAELSVETKQNLQKARRDIKEGRVISTVQLIRELGV